MSRSEHGADDRIEAFGDRGGAGEVSGAGGLMVLDHPVQQLRFELLRPAQPGRLPPHGEHGAECGDRVDLRACRTHGVHQLLDELDRDRAQHRGEARHLLRGEERIGRGPDRGVLCTVEAVGHLEEPGDGGGEGLRILGDLDRLGMAQYHPGAVRSTGERRVSAQLVGRGAGFEAGGVECRDAHALIVGRPAAPSPGLLSCALAPAADARASRSRGRRGASPRS